MGIRVVGIAGWKTPRVLNAALAEIGAKGELTVRWGINRQGVGTEVGGWPRLNAIDQLVAMREAGVPTVPWTAERHVAETWVKEGYGVFGRDLVHTQGRDIVGAGLGYGLP